MLRLPAFLLNTRQEINTTAVVFSVVISIISLFWMNIVIQSILHVFSGNGSSSQMQTEINMGPVSSLPRKLHILML